MTSTVRVINPIINTQPDKLRVAAYCRVSSDSADQQNSFLTQVRHYTELIGEHSDWRLADIYADEGLTGTRADTRLEFQRLLKDCKKGKIDRVLTKSISRFSRNTKDCLESIRALRLLGVSIYFQKENMDTALLGDELMLGIFASLAQEESMSISGNMRWSYEKRMKSGEFITCSPAYGYILEKRSLVRDEEKSPVIKRIFSDYLSGKSTTQIAAGLTAESVPTKNGSTVWRRSAVAYILGNEKYIGNALVQKTCTTDTLPFRKCINKGEKDRYYIKNTHEPLISDQAFQQAEILLERRRGTYSPKGAPTRYPLTEKITCGVCTSTYKRKCRTDNIPYWVCRGHDESMHKCPNKQIREAEIHAAFLRMWTKLRRNYRYILQPLLDGLLALGSKAAVADTGIGIIDKEILELNEQNLALNRLRTKGYLDSVFFMQQANEIAAKISALRQKRGKLLSSDEDDSVTDGIKALMSILEQDATAPCGFDTELFGRVVDKIIVLSQDRLTFRLLGGVELTEPMERSSRS